MTHVWLVTAGRYSSYRVIGAFSTKDKADAYAKEHTDADAGGYDAAEVESWSVDELADHTNQTLHWIKIAIDGHVIDSGHKTDVYAPRYSKAIRVMPYWFFAESVVSPDHALKLAAEERQAWLREPAI